MVQFGDERLPLRFWNKVSPCPVSGCWLWTAAHYKAGYGVMRFNEHNESAHRIAFLALVGPIPHGLVIDHRCSMPPCVNPLHLRAITQSENVMAGTSNAAKSVGKTKCGRGHRYDYYHGGRRRCTTCDSAASQARQEMPRTEEHW